MMLLRLSEHAQSFVDSYVGGASLHSQLQTCRFRSCVDVAEAVKFVEMGLINDANWMRRLVIVLMCVVSSSSLYFHIAETERKCFMEDLPDDTMVIGNYRVHLFDPKTGGFMPSTQGIGMHVEVRTESDKVILSKVYSAEGRFTFTSSDPGEHIICLYSNSTKWFSGTQLRVHLDIQVGEHAIDYQNVAQKDKLNELQVRVRQLLDKVEQITKEQNYQRYREERFRQTSESTNQRVLWWSITQTAVLLVMGLWQMRHLRYFFEAKKLV